MSEKLIGYADNFGPGTELNTVEEVACFIYEKGLYGDVTIEKDGFLFISTFGFYLNWIADQQYRLKLLDVLIPLQMGETTVEEVRSRHTSEEGGARND